MQKAIVFFLFLIGSSLQVCAQQDWRFYEDIQAFKKQDSISMPAEGGILFIGSSSIRMWADLKDRFKEYPIIQRGFGGCEYLEILHYADDIIIPYKPSKIILYAGENDFARGRSVDDIYNTFMTLYHKIRKELPSAAVYIISVKPSEKLKEYRQGILAINDRMKEFTDLYPDHIRYIDIYHPMLDKKGEPKPELFVADQLHLSTSGYDLWEATIREFL